MSRCSCIAAAFLAVCLIAPEVSALPRKKDRWIELESDHFTFYSNAGGRATRRIADDLELLRRVLAELSNLQVVSPVPTTVFVFDSKTTFTPYKFLRHGEPANVAGYFSPREHGNYIAVDIASTSSATAIVYHEYIHYFTRNNLPPLPPWLGEGLAEFYSTFDTDARHVNIGKPIGRSVGWLRDSELMPLAELLTADSALFDEETKQGGFYAQSWALVHYLIVGNPERSPQLVAYLNLLAGNVAHEEAFLQAFQTDFEGLEHELRGYLRRRLFSYHRYELQASYKGSGEFRSLPYHEVLYRLGDLLAIQEEQRPEAVEHFQAAIDLAPDYAPAVAGLGYLADRQQRHEEAEALYARALGLADDDYLVLYRYASSLLRKDRSQASSCRELLRRSLVLEPGFAPTWALLTYVQTLDDEPPDKTALQVGERALRMLPRRPDVAHNLLVLYARSGDREAARKLVDGYFARLPDAAQRREAEKVLFNMDLRRAYELADGDRMAEASQLADALEARAAGLADLFPTQEITQLRQTIAAKRTAGSYDEAVALFNAGKLEEAKILFEELAADDSAPRQATAREFLLRIEKSREGDAGRLRQTAAKPGAQRGRKKPVDDGRREELNRLLAQNRLEEAVRLLEEMKASSPNDAFWIDARLKQVRHALAYNRFVDDYNEAVDLVNSGVYEKAVTLLEKLVAETPTEQDAEDVRQLLEQARARLKGG